MKSAASLALTLSI